jgi:uncharacterized lipoprotein YmbA
MKLPRSMRALAELALVCWLWGCVNVELETRPAPVRRYFALDIEGVAPAGFSTESNGVLKLAPVRVAYRYDAKGFTYRIGPESFETDFYNQFLVAPGPMLTDELRQVLARANVFELVIDTTSLVNPTHLLEATVDELYGDFRGDSAGSAVLAMSFVLSQSNGPARLVQKRYEKVIPLKARSPEALVDGWNRGLEEISAALVRDLSAVTEARR